jgi:ABC-type branched-subunit amino acid transport system substrate-binding protein
MSQRFILRRRAFALGAASLVAAPVLAQQGRAAAPRGSITVAQIVDASPAQQDVSKDFLIGSRAAWQDVNARGGIRGRTVNHQSVDVDGTPASVRAALAQLKDNASCVVLSGSAGDPVATLVSQELRQDGAGLAHVAPWLQNSSLEVDDRTFPIFAGRQEQIGHALKSLTAMGVQDVGVVYASDAEQRQFREDMERAAAGMKVRLQTFRGEGDLTRLGQRLTPGTPAILLFVGGTPELVQFTQGLEKQQRQRYVIALADVNLQTIVQMGGARTTPVILAQPVPVVTAGLPVVRTYREVLSRLFDEPPASLSLAGFIAARYTYEVLASVEGALTRPAVLAAFQRRRDMDLGGFRVSYDERRRSSTFVTQSMLTQDGRIIG